MRHTHALEIVKTLHRNGHVAYFAGGWVRDYVMKKDSDDIDIATSASPEQIIDLFPKTLLVGIQFGVVIVLINSHQYEVSTFRKDLAYTNGRTPDQIEQTNAVEDAKRRDFTINGMFYDPIKDQIHDYVGGLEDIQKGIIRAIGDPFERFFEDRLRMVRAFRFSARFSFVIDPVTEAAIFENAPFLFPAVAMERVWNEFCKMHAYPNFDRALIEMHRLGLLPIIFPSIKDLHLKELEKRVSVLKHYPSESPASLFIQELFPEADLNMLSDIAKYLKISNKEQDHLLTYVINRPFVFNTPYEKVVFYAHPFAELYLKVYAARLTPHEKSAFLDAHMQTKETLKDHVKRLVEKKPLVSSSDLSKIGIPAGKQMGVLLKEGEKLSINLDLNTKESVLAALMKQNL